MSSNCTGNIAKVERPYRSHVPFLIIITAISFSTWGCGGNTQKQSTLPPTKKSPEKQAVSSEQPEAKSSRIDPEAKVIPSEKEVVWVIKPLVNVRSQPSTTANIVTKLKAGAQVSLIEKQDHWWEISWSDTTRGFIHENMISGEKPVDPWTQFRLGCRLADSTLEIVTAVEEVKGTTFPSAFVTVSDDWQKLSHDELQKVAEAAFSYWKKCIQQSGSDVKGSYIIVRDKSRAELAKASAGLNTLDETIVEFLK